MVLLSMLFIFTTWKKNDARVSVCMTELISKNTKMDFHGVICLFRERVRNLTNQPTHSQKKSLVRCSHTPRYIGRVHCGCELRRTQVAFAGRSRFFSAGGNCLWRRPRWRWRRCSSSGIPCLGASTGFSISILPRSLDPPCTERSTYCGVFENRSEYLHWCFIQPRLYEAGNTENWHGASSFWRNFTTLNKWYTVH